MDIRYFIGVDISKATAPADRLDWAVFDGRTFDGRTIVLQSQSANTEVAIRATVKLIKGLPGFVIAQSVCCVEHTGIYCTHLLSSRAAAAFMRFICRFGWRAVYRSKKRVVCNGERLILLMPSVLRSMPFGFAIRYDYGNLNGLFCKN